MSNEAVKKKSKVVLFLWALPLLALLLSSWTLYKHFNKLNEEITVVFDNAEGFAVNKTALKYKGIKIGVVSDIDLDESDITKFLVKIKLSGQTKEVVAREGSEFWKVEPKLSVGEISGLNTLISGNYIEVRPRDSAVKDVLKENVQTYFYAIESRPIDVLEKGKFISLKSDKGDLSLGAPVLYKSFVVGEIYEKTLENDDVIYKVFIKEEYASLLKDSSNFWRVSGVEVKASLSGLKIDIENFETLLAGGVAFDSNKKDTKLALANQQFKLHNSKEDIAYSSKLILLKSKEAYTLEEEFSKVFYNGYEVGRVKTIEYNAQESLSYITLQLKHSAQYIMNLAPYFQIIQAKVSLSKIEGLNTLLKSNYIKVTTHSKKNKAVKPFYSLNENEKKISMYEVILKTQNTTKISKDSPVYYKNIKVGYVSSYYLNKKRNEVVVKLRIYWIYRDMINDSSLFYEQSPVELKADLKGVIVKTAPLKSFLLSGIAFVTNDLKQKSTKKSFPLYSNLTEIKKQVYLQNRGQVFKIRVDNASEVKKGLEIYYKGMEIGRVMKSKYIPLKDEIHFDIFILDQFTNLLNESTRFYSLSSIDVDLSLDKVNIKTKSFYSMFNGGISFYTEDKNAKSVTKNHLFEFDKSEEEAQEKFVNANILMPRGFDLKQGSKILYKDIPIGSIQDLQFMNDGQIKANIRIQKAHENLLNKETLFYLDDFKFSVGGVQNPSAAIFGPRIKMIAGTSSVKQNSFTLITYKPFEAFDKEGLRVVVHAKLKSSLKQNSPIYYRQVQIGAVENFELAQDGSSVKLQLFIEKKYQHLVRENSIFYNAGAFGVDLYLFGVKIKTETLETMMNGGISLVTPTQYGKQAKAHYQFELKEDLEEEWLDWHPQISKP